MTEKRFIIDVEEITQENAVFEDGNCYCFEDDSEALVERLNQYADENEQLKNSVNILDKVRNELIDENEQLKHDATVLIQVNQDYRKENERLKKQIDELINSIQESARMGADAICKPMMKKQWGNIE